MIHVLVTSALARPLLNLVLRAGFVSVARDLRGQLPTEEALPVTDEPVLSIRYRGLTFDYYDEAYADEVWDLFEAACQARREARESEAPLLALVEEA